MVYFESSGNSEETAEEMDSLIYLIGNNGKFLNYFNEAKRQYIADRKFNEYSSWEAVGAIASSYLAYNDPMILFKSDSIAESIQYKDIQEFVKKYVNNGVVFTAKKQKEAVYNAKIPYKVKNYEDEQLKNGNVVRFYETERDDYSIILVSFAFGNIDAVVPGSGRILEGVINEKMEETGFLKKTNSQFYCRVQDKNTIIGFKTLKKDYNEALFVLKELFADKSISASSFKREKNRLQNDVKNSNEDPADVAWNIFIRKYFTGGGIYLSMPEEKEVVEITIDDVKSDLTNLWSGNQSVYVNGFYTKESVRKFADEIYSQKQMFGRDKMLVSYSVFDTVISEVENDQSSIYIGYSSDDVFNEREMYALYLFSAFFSGSKSVIHNALRGENDYVYYGYGYLYNTGVKPSFFLNAQTSKEKTDFVVTVMEDVLNKMAKGDFTEEDLDAQKKEMVLRLRFEFSDRLQSMMGDLNSIESGYKDRKYVLQEKINGISKQEIIDAAGKLLKNQAVFIYK